MLPTNNILQGITFREGEQSSKSFQSPIFLSLALVFQGLYLTFNSLTLFGFTHIELIRGGLPASATLTSASSASNSMSHHPSAHPPHPPPVYSLSNISASAASPPPAVAPPPAAVPPPATASVASQSGALGEDKSHQGKSILVAKCEKHGSCGLHILR